MRKDSGNVVKKIITWILKLYDAADYYRQKYFDWIKQLHADEIIFTIDLFTVEIALWI